MEADVRMAAEAKELHQPKETNEGKIFWGKSCLEINFENVTAHVGEAKKKPKKWQIIWCYWGQAWKAIKNKDSMSEINNSKQQW